MINKVGKWSFLSFVIVPGILLGDKLADLDSKDGDNACRPGTTRDLRAYRLGLRRRRSLRSQDLRFPNVDTFPGTGKMTGPGTGHGGGGFPGGEEGGGEIYG